MVKKSRKKYVHKPQLDLFVCRQPNKMSFGGNCIKSHPKIARPFSSKHLIHVILKSERASGAFSFYNFEREILKILRNLERSLGVSVKDVVVMGNHIHLSLKTNSRRAFQTFLKATSGLIARCVLKAEKGRASLIKNFFAGRPFSRIVAQGRKSFEILENYFQLNRLEKAGCGRKEGRSFLKQFVLQAKQFTTT